MSHYFKFVHNRWGFAFDSMGLPFCRFVFIKDYRNRQFAKQFEWQWELMECILNVNLKYALFGSFVRHDVLCDWTGERGNVNSLYNKQKWYSRMRNTLGERNFPLCSKQLKHFFFKSLLLLWKILTHYTIAITKPTSTVK